METKKEDKKLSPIEYLEILQKEFFVCEIRMRFYPSPRDKQYYKKVRALKREKIERIGKENKIPTIFTSELTASRFKELVCSSEDYPIFEMSMKDWQNYYAPDQDVKVLADEEILLGRTVKFYGGGEYVAVKLKDTEKENLYKREKVIRVLGKV